MDKKVIKGIAIVAVAVGLIVAYCVAGWYSETDFSLYIQDYEKELGIWGNITPEKLIKKYGKPEKVDTQITSLNDYQMDRLITLTIEENEFNFTQTYRLEGDSKIPDVDYKRGVLGNYVLKNDRIKLGKKEISVGSSRKEVIAAYGDNGTGKKPGDRYAASDWNRGTAEFYYDENDIVEKIEVYPYGTI